jgi:hypothetical protein
MTERQRQRNVELLLTDLRQGVAPLAALPALQADAVAWLARCSAAETAAHTAVNQAWQMIQGPAGLAAAARALQERALDVIVPAVGDAALVSGADVLREMGFTVQSEPTSDGVRTITGRDADDHRAFLTLGDSGALAVKFEGYHGQACREALQRFLALMEQRQLVSAFQERYTLTDAVQRLAGLLHEAGLQVKIEPTDDGALVTATGAVSNQPGAAAAVGAAATLDHDGRLRVPVELQQAWQARVRAAETGAPAQQLEDEWIRRQQDQQQTLAGLRIRTAAG